MDIFSAIKQHMADGAAAAAAGEGHHPTSRSFRSVFSAGEASAKYRQQRPARPLSVQTKDISWPVGSGDRSSPRLDDYDVVSPSDARSPQCMSAGTTRSHSGRWRRLQRADSTGADSLLTVASSARPATAAAATAPPCTCASASLAYTTTAASPPHSSTLPLRTAAPLGGARVRRAGTATRALSPRPAHHRAAPDVLCQSLTSLDLSRSTTSTVVAATLAVAADRPASSRSRGSANSGTLVPDPGARPGSGRSAKEGDDDDALRGPPPRDDWDIVLDLIKEYRASHEAPVDTVGCEALTEEEKDPKLRRFRSLVSLMLSAQTKDEITAEAVRTLSHRLPGGLTPRALSEAPIDLIHECVRRVGFWQRKSNYIREAARTCLEQYDGDIPRTVPQLLALPGVGPKMAYLAMHAAWQDTQGIGVDTHVLRITHRLGWVPESAKTPEATRHALEAWMPRSLWREINPLLVGLGQTVCRAVGPRCGECPASRFCPSAQARPRPGTARRMTARSAHRMQHDAVMSDSAEFGDVDVEDLASMVRGAEHAVRSRKLGAAAAAAAARPRNAGARAAKAAFPEIPESPLGAPPAPDPAGQRVARARAASRLRPRQASTPAAKHNHHHHHHEAPAAGGSGALRPGSDSECASALSDVVSTPSSSPHFSRLRSNAASEMVRPEAKTDSVRMARERATAKRVYSRRLSRSDMQWALGEDWDPDDSSSLSSLSDAAPDDNDSDNGNDADGPAAVARRA
ncbi:alpha,alpha-trehalase nth1 [Coemansia javaensis]|uniref:Endonuclease III homolog n=1 Tax=Coemansia javaensis TaxID=2761396 RepID=A0A9W8LGE6_9FUNG|nr:alpha,alpha-trehalase nth1 [Coemansia javaensis]